MKLEEFRQPFETVELYKIPNFLNSQECDYLVSLINQHLVRSTISGGSEEHSIVSDTRISYTSVLDHEDVNVREVDFKIRKLLDISHHGESIQGQKYEIGGKFTRHTDYFQEGSIQKHCVETGMGNRSWTCMIYLNEDMLGGETDFPNLDVKFKPEKGLALLWKNTDESKEYVDTLHSGEPVISGEKYIITKWFRNDELFSYHPKATFSSKFNLPKFTSKGFTVLDVPSDVWGIISDTYKLLQKDLVVENTEGVISSQESEVAAHLMSMDALPNIRNYIHKTLQPIHENWCNQKLEMTACYGIRSYNRGAELIQHFDHIDTHHISCIILVDEDSEEPWPLQIQNNNGVWENIYIKPGQMILYESATCEHGRITPFKGNFFRNFFVHYKLVDFKYESE